MAIRRVVTGHDAQGRARVVLDEVLPLTARSSIWAADMPATLPDDGAPPAFAGPLLPMPGGLHVVVLTLPPKFRRDAAAMHATASVDCMMQVSGQSVFMLENTEVVLEPGDWLISNGVIHDWRNDLASPSVMIGVIYGAHQKETLAFDPGRSDS